MGGGDSGYKSVVYFVNWAIYARNHNPQDLHDVPITHVLYSFANVRPESGEVYLTDSWSDTDKHYPSDSWNDSGTNLYGCMKQLFLLKKQSPNLKVLLSVGGWTYSSNFAQPAGTESSRKRFADSAVQLLEDLGLDGIDIDWEYPKDAQEADNYVKLLAEMREALHRSSRKHDGAQFLLTIACPAGPSNFEKLKITEMDRYLDFWNLMAYDYAGSWDAKAAHQANLYPSRQDPACTPFSTAAAIEHYTKHGVHPSKLVLGMPLYGRTFMATAGPGQSYNGVGEGSWEQGVWDYKALPRPGSAEYHDHGIGASWSYDKEKRTMVSYDTIDAVKQKADFVRGHHLGGGMWWESSGDRAQGNGSLIGTFVDSVGGRGSLDQSPNCLTYPHSRYENLRNGFS